MAWWSKNEPKIVPPDVREDLRTVSSQLDKLEREVKSLRLEWEESYDKLHHLMARITKRQKAAQTEQETLQDASQSTNGREAGGPLPPAPAGMHNRLMAMRSRHGLLPR